MNRSGTGEWSAEQVQAGLVKLNQEAGLAEYPVWVHECAMKYLLGEMAKDELVPLGSELFQARTDYERHIRFEIGKAKSDLWKRRDWLQCGTWQKHFGSIATVPDLIAGAAIMNIEQQLFNLCGGQRRIPIALRYGMEATETPFDALVTFKQILALDKNEDLPPAGWRNCSEEGAAVQNSKTPGNFDKAGR